MILPCVLSVLLNAVAVCSAGVMCKEIIHSWSVRSGRSHTFDAPRIPPLEERMSIQKHPTRVHTSHVVAGPCSFT